jgi:hypothetical protein
MAKHTAWFKWLVAIADRHGDHTQQDIARTLGVSKSTITGWAKGTPPNPENVLKAAERYGIDPAELFHIAYYTQLIAMVIPTVGPPTSYGSATDFGHKKALAPRE